MTRYWIPAAQSECRRENRKILQRGTSLPSLPNNFRDSLTRAIPLLASVEERSCSRRDRLLSISWRGDITTWQENVGRLLKHLKTERFCGCFFSLVT